MIGGTIEPEARPGVAAQLQEFFDQDREDTVEHAIYTSRFLKAREASQPTIAA